MSAKSYPSSSAVVAPASRPREDVARDLVRNHFLVEPALDRVLFLRSNDPEGPIFLLESNAATYATGSIEPLAFGPTADVPFVTIVAEVTPEELEAIEKNELSLPKGWSLEDATLMKREDFNGVGGNGGGA